MDKKNFQHLVLNESYVLGWELTKSCLILYTEFLLTKSHSCFVGYDESKDFGCYKQGHMLFKDIVSVKGLPVGKKDLKWNEIVKEFEDIYEINEIREAENTMIIETDEGEIIIEGKSAVCFIK